MKLALQNPEKKGANNPGLDEKADYSKEQQKQFDGTPGQSLAQEMTSRHQRSCLIPRGPCLIYVGFVGLHQTVPYLLSDKLHVVCMSLSASFACQGPGLLVLLDASSLLQ